MTTETYENVYSVFDRNTCRDWTGIVVEAAWKMLDLPAPTISPTCKKDGHDWSRPMVLMPGAEVRACRRCSKRGMVVLQTTGRSV